MATVTFYGGVGEIGGNKVLIQDSDTSLLLDFGVCFDHFGRYYEEFLKPRTNNELRDLLNLGLVPSLEGIYREDLLTLPGLDKIVALTNQQAEYLWRTRRPRSYEEVLSETGRPGVDAVIISHAHLDHIEYLGLLDERIPVYCTEITEHVIRVVEELAREDVELTHSKRKAIAEVQRTGNPYFPGSLRLREEVRNARQFVTLGDGTSIGNVRLRLVPVDHSVPGAATILLYLSNGKTILYTGDLRFHGRRSDYTEGFLQLIDGLRPDVLITEGTRIADDRADDERQVEEECTRLISQTSGLAMVAFAWKDTTRYLTLREVARRTGRILVISPKLAYLLYQLRDVAGAGVGDITSEPDVPVYLDRKDSMLYSKNDYTRTKYEAAYSVIWDRPVPPTFSLHHYDNGVRAYHVQEHPERYILHLDYYDFNELIDIKPPPGSLFIVARSEPFNEEMRLDEQRIVNWLKRFDLNKPDHRPIYVHASGHASGPELIDMILRSQPQTVVPVHTEHPELFLERLHGSGIEVRVPEYGVPMEFD